MFTRIPESEMMETRKGELPALVLASLRIGIGMFLCIAGYSKLFPLDPMLVGGEYLLPKSVVGVISVVEILAGISLIFLSRFRSSWYFAALLFAGFTVIQILNLSVGQSTCNCTSLVDMSVTQMLIIDSLILLVLLYAMFGTSSKPWNQDCPIISSSSGSFAGMLRGFAVLTLVGVCITIPVFGSSSVFAGKVVGMPAAAHTPRKFAGEIPVKQITPVEFRVQNLTSQRLNIVGSKSSCGCTSLPGLPLDIEPGGSRLVTVLVVGLPAHLGKVATFETALKFREVDRPLLLEVFATVTDSGNGEHD